MKDADAPTRGFGIHEDAPKVGECVVRERFAKDPRLFLPRGIRDDHLDARCLFRPRVHVEGKENVTRFGVRSHPAYRLAECRLRCRNAGDWEPRRHTRGDALRNLVFLAVGGNRAGVVHARTHVP